MSIGSRIKERREELEITQVELAKRVGVSKGSIGNYESGVSAPNEKILYKLFSALKCDANFLYQDDMKAFSSKDDFKIKPTEKSMIKKYRSLDQFGKKAVDDILNDEYERCLYVEKEPSIKLRLSLLKASAGTGNWLDDEQMSTIKVIDTPEARKADIVIEVDGDSMFPTFDDGDKVLVRLQPAVEIGEVGIFILDGNGYIKKFADDRLISLNPEYDDVYPSEYSDFRCIGKVIGKAKIVE